MTEKEYNHCVDLYADRLYRFIVKNIRREDEAQDIVQNSFEALWKNRQDLAAEKARAWLFSTAYHNMIDQIRKQKKIQWVEQVPDTTLAATPQTDLKHLLDQGMQRLNNIQRTLLLLKDYEGYRYEEIGEITGLTTSQVKVYLHRARLKMREYLVKMENVL